MRNLLLRFATNAVAMIVITSGVLPGIRITGDAPLLTVIVVAIIFGVVNAFIKPLVQFVTCPFILLTFGLFTFVINGLMLYLTAALSQFTAQITGGKLEIENVLWALLGAFIVAVIGLVLDRLLGTEQRVKVRKVVETRTIIEDRRSQIDREFDDLLNRGGEPPIDFSDPKPRR